MFNSSFIQPRSFFKLTWVPEMSLPGVLGSLMGVGVSGLGVPGLDCAIVGLGGMRSGILGNELGTGVLGVGGLGEIVSSVGVGSRGTSQMISTNQPCGGGTQVKRYPRQWQTGTY